MKKLNTNMKTLAFTLAAGLCLSSQLAADTLRQHDAHVHGQAVGNLTLDEGDLRLELEIPGVNLVGFEHPPRDQSQRDQLAAVLAALDGAQWLSVDQRGRCELASVNAHTHGFGDQDHGDEHGHDGDYEPDAGHDHHQHDHDGDHHHADDHGHDHEHGHQHEHKHNGHDHVHHSGDELHHDHDHAEFHIVVRWQCEAPDALRWVDLNLFDNYPGNELIVVNVLTERMAGQFRLQPGRHRASLEP